MFFARASIVAVLAMTFIISIDQGEALSCRVCNSKDNSLCLKEPSKVETTQCNSEPDVPGTTTTDPTSDGTGSTPDGTESTPDGTGSTPGVTGSTPGVPESTPVVPESTPVVPESTPVVPESTPVVPESTPVVPESTPVVPESTPVVPESTPVVPESTPLANNDDNGGNAGEESEETVPRAAMMNPRSRRAAPFIRAGEAACYTLTYKDNGTDVVERGCTIAEGCDKLAEGKSESSCKVCNDKDSCNGSSQIALGMMSIVFPAILVLTVFRQ